MPQVPEFSRETRLNGTALPYEHYNLTDDMFGGSQAKATMKMSEGFGELANKALKLSEQIDETKMVEMSNKLSQWEENNLYNKDTGYYYMNGKDAVGKSTEVMKNFDEFVNDYKSQNRVSFKNQARMDSIIAAKKARITQGVNAHDFQQTTAWAETEGKTGIDNAIKGMINSRNNPQEMNTHLDSALQIVDWQGGLQKLDADTINAKKQEIKSNAYSAVLESYIGEGSLKAGEYFNQHKNEINPKLHAKYIASIKSEEMKYNARTTATNIIASAKDEEDAIKKAENIKDVNLSDMVVSRIKRHYSDEQHYKDLEQKNALNSFYNKAVEAAQNGTSLSYDDIPNILDPQDKLSLMNYVNKSGQPEDDGEIWESLYDMSVNNAQGFVKEDLNKYRGFLSDSQYQSFKKKQEEIKAGKFYSNIKDDDEMIKSALKSIGLSSDGKQKSAFSEIRALTREFEARKGRKITDEELQNITNSLGYKGDDGVQLYKKLEKGMAQRVGFTKDVMNDIAYYQSKHNGEMPSDAEKYKIINNRLNKQVQENKTYAQQLIDNRKTQAVTMRNIAYTVPKPHEQKVLTYFADNQIPTISKQLGIKLTISSRYRNQQGSHHAEGRAADVSMSEHNIKNRIKIYEKLLALPTVQALGTSDPNILAHFAGNRKIVDERKYDRQHGTNHVNHVHVTLINANPAKPNNGTKLSNNIYRL
nr:MAG TPA: hypothetical protein [Caudoviricetes sp.]